MIRLHGIDAPELDQTFQWRGQQIACGTMSLAALDALIAGVKVRCEVVERHGRQGLLARRGRHRPQVGVGGAGVAAGTRWTTSARGTQSQARDVAGHLCQTVALARIVTAAHAGICFGDAAQEATAAGRIVIV
jgi:hypothetical protein